MKYFIIAIALVLTSFTAHAGNGIQCFRDGVEIVLPPAAQWVPIPMGYNTAPCDKFYNPKGFGCWPKPPPSNVCDSEPYACGCPKACDGPTPGGLCRRQDLLEKVCDKDPDAPACYQLPLVPQCPPEDDRKLVTGPGE